MNAPASWTDARVAELRQLVEKGLSAEAISARLGGVTRNAVIGKVHRLGLAFARGWGEHETPAAKKARAARPAVVRNPKAPRAAPPLRPPAARAVAVAAPAPEPAIDPTPKAWPKPAGPDAVDIVGLKAGLCHMPLWGIEARGGLYCGKPVRAEGQRWCAACTALVYERRPIRQQEEANAARARQAKQLSHDGAFA